MENVPCETSKDCSSDQFCEWPIIVMNPLDAMGGFCTVPEDRQVCETDSECSFEDKYCSLTPSDNTETAKGVCMVKEREQPSKVCDSDTDCKPHQTCRNIRLVTGAVMKVKRCISK